MFRKFLTKALLVLVEFILSSVLKGVPVVKSWKLKKKLLRFVKLLRRENLLNNCVNQILYS